LRKYGRACEIEHDTVSRNDIGTAGIKSLNPPPGTPNCLTNATGELKLALLNVSTKSEVPNTAPSPF